MKNMPKVSLRHLSFFCLLLLFCPHKGTADPIPAWGRNDREVATCSAPSPFQSGQGSGTLSFAWAPVGDATGYQIQYLNKSTNTLSNPVATGDAHVTVSGLAAGAYRFYFATVCGDQLSEFVIVDDLIIL